MNPAVAQSDYEKKQQEEALNKRKMEIGSKVAILENKLQNTTHLSSLQLMDLVQEAISACGGEPKIQYLEVSSSFIKVFTRVPMDSNLFQFMGESLDNPRFHKVITKMFLLSPCVDIVRWMPSNADRGSYLMITLKSCQ